ncbi:MAG: SLC13 family permease [Candidatus Freyarchaeota archaeon]
MDPLLRGLLGLVQSPNLWWVEYALQPPFEAVVVFGGILFVTFALIVTERIHQTVAALAGAVATIIAGKYFSLTYSWAPVLSFLATGVPHELLFSDLEVFTEFVDWPTIFIIISVMIITAVTERSGLFEYIALKVIKSGGGNLKRMFLYLWIVSFLLASVLGITPAFIIIGALILTITKVLELNPVPYILSCVFVILAASTSTVLSTLANILVASHFNLNPFYYLSYDGFIMLGFPFALVSLAIAVAFTFWKFSDSFRIHEEEEYKEIRSKILAFDENMVIGDRRLFRIVSVLLIVTIIAFVVGGLMGIPGIFIIVGGVDRAGILQSMGTQIGYMGIGNPATMTSLIYGFTCVFSGVVDEVSVVAVMVYAIPYISKTAFISPGLIIWAVLYGANAGTSLTPVGGIPNMIAISELEKENVKVTWLGFMKIGIPITVLRVVTGILLLLFLASLLGWGVDFLGTSLL